MLLYLIQPALHCHDARDLSQNVNKHCTVDVIDYNRSNARVNIIESVSHTAFEQSSNWLLYVGIAKIAQF